MPRNSDRDSNRDRDRDDRGGRGRGRNERDDDDFEYAGRSSEDNSRRAKQSSGRYDSYLIEQLPYFSPKAGEHCIRIIPWLNGKDPEFKELVEKWGSHWGIDLIWHRNVGPDKGTYLCLDKMLGEPCPPCDVWREESEEDLKPSDRVLCWLIDRDDEKTGPKLWAMPLANSKDISAVSQVKGRSGEEGALLLIDHPEDGYDVYFDVEGEKDRTRYKRFEVARDPSPLHENDKKMKAWLSYVKDHRLPDLLKFYDADYLEKMLSGQISKEDDDNGDSDGDRSSRRRRPSEEDNGGGRSSRRGRGADPDETPRGSRGRSRGDADPEGSSDEDTGERGSRRGERGSRASANDDRGGSRRGRGAEPDPDPDDDPGDVPDEGRSSRRGAARGGGNERYRAPKDDDNGDGDTEAAKGRLRNVGRRGAR